jgi:hypothetical protein
MSDASEPSAGLGRCKAGVVLRNQSGWFRTVNSFGVPTREAVWATFDELSRVDPGAGIPVGSGIILRLDDDAAYDSASTRTA